MAGIFVRITPTAEFTLGNSGGWKTLLLFKEHLVDGSQGFRSRVVSWGVYPFGTVNSDPHVRTRLIKAGGIGTGGTSANAKVINGVGDGARFNTLLQGTFSVEPDVSGQVALDYKGAHPQSGIEWPAVEPNEIYVATAEILLVQYFNDSGASGLKALADLLLEQ